MTQKLIGIMAMTSDEVIAINDKLPVSSKVDMKHFKNMTMGNTVIMGRKTFDTLSKPLVDRLNIVLTKDKLRTDPHVYFTNSILKALHFATTPEDKRDIFVIGGAELYKQLTPLCDEFYLTVYGTCADYSIKDKVTFSPYTHEDFRFMFPHKELQYFTESDSVFGTIYHYRK